MHLRYLLFLCLFGFGSVANAADDEPQPPLTVEIVGRAPQVYAIADYWQSYFAVKEWWAVRLDKGDLQLKMRVHVIGDPKIPSDKIRFRLRSEDIDKEVPLQNYWADMPYDEAAYAQRASFTANYPPKFIEIQHHVTFAKNADGVYDGSYLAAACDKALAATRAMNLKMRFKFRGSLCRGAIFVLNKDKPLDYLLEGIPPSSIQSSPSNSDLSNTAFAVTFPGHSAWSVRFAGEILAVLPFYAEEGHGQ